jgi:hypothetical protein
MLSAILRFAFLLVASAVAIGCADREPAQPVRREIDIETVIRGHQLLRDQTQRRFAQASFLSPQPGSEAGIPLWMAPLLVHEYATATADEPRWTRFGALTLDSTGRATVDCDQPTVYLLAAEIMVGSQSLKQLTYWWFYPPVASGHPIRFRGFRMTLGGRGHAVVWDVVSSDSGDRIFYVSKPVEQAAAKQYGGPLPGRRYAVEPPVQEQPEVVVPRIIGDGPQPMGPFVYLDASSLEPTTLICRCEPSQADRFPHSSHYRLQQIDTPRDLYGSDSPPPNLLLPPIHASPEGVLRLPDRL